MRRECLVFWVSANKLLAAAYTELSDHTRNGCAHATYTNIYGRIRPLEQG
jgi:hypothetical protein